LRPVAQGKASMLPERNIGDRVQIFNRSFYWGGLVGVILGAIIFWPLLMPPADDAKAEPVVLRFQNWIVSALYTGVFVSMPISLVTRWFTTHPTHRAILFRLAPRGILIGFVVWLWLAVFVFGGEGRKDLTFRDLALRMAVGLLVCIGVGAFLGMVASERHVTDRENEEREAALARLGGVNGHGDADEQRRALATALAEKFGPLDAEMCERIRSWDEGRVAKARRKLPDANTIDELE
jgi:hypothetical protein